jgi:DNA-binding transcriptional MerR regulator
MDELYSIGDVARRTGLSVSAIRFYSDAGVITPTAHTGAGYRRYNIRAVASLELIRTLRELGASLEDIRQLLADEITLPDLAAAHLALVERQLSRFQARRAVLRTIVRQHTATEQVSLMHKLASMSDDDRVQLIEDFWTEVTHGLGIQDFIDYLRPWRPRLPEEPTSEQLEAWIELADLVQDAAFRQEVRQYFQDTFAMAADERESTPTEDEVEHQVAILAEAKAAAESGLPVDSPQAQELAGRWVTWWAARTRDQNTADVQRQITGADPAPHVARHAALLGRYNTLTATINGAPPPEATDAPASTWLHAAVKALT